MGTMDTPLVPIQCRVCSDLLQSLPKLVDVPYSCGIAFIHAVGYVATRLLHLYSFLLKICSFLICSDSLLTGYSWSSLDHLAPASFGYLHVINP